MGTEQETVEVLKKRIEELEAIIRTKHEKYYRYPKMYQKKQYLKKRIAEDKISRFMAKTWWVEKENNSKLWKYLDQDMREYMEKIFSERGFSEKAAE